MARLIKFVEFLQRARAKLRLRRRLRDFADIREVDQFFAEDDQPGLAYPALATFVYFLAILTSGAWILLFVELPRQEPPNFILHGMDYQTAEKAVGVLGFLSTIFVSLVASVLAVALINRVNLLKIKFVKDLTQPEAVKTVLKNLKSYGGRYSEGKRVELVFDDLRISADGFTVFKVTQTVTVRMPIQRKELILDFAMLERGGVSDSVSYDLQSDAVPDDGQSIDITDIKRHFPDEWQSMFPGLIEVIIDSEPQRLRPQLVDRKKHHLRWKIDTRRHLGSGLVELMYRYSYYQEAPGFAYQEVSEPTKGFLYTLDFAAVADQISVYRVGNLNARTSGQEVGKRKKRRTKLQIGTSEWVIPNTTIVYCWYKKSDPQAGCADPHQTVLEETPSGEAGLQMQEGIAPAAPSEAEARATARA